MSDKQTNILNAGLAESGPSEPRRDTELLDGDIGGVYRAVELIKQGKLVAMPTETVYGLAARADSAEAVAAIYRAKGRPDFNPLIVHVGSMALARTLAHFDARAEKVAAAFWPGPLTLVLPARADSPVTPAVTAGLPTVAIRMPAHSLTRHLLEAVDLPIAAPSANRSGAVSPTTADHVWPLGDRIAAILNGGPCESGLESTIIALREDASWQLLRHGPIGESALTQLLGESVPVTLPKIEAPGQLARHYSPGKPLRLEADQPDSQEFMIGFGQISGDVSLSPSGDLAEAAARLYACLHLAAASDKPRIAIAPLPRGDIGAAINDRLLRAATV